MSWTTDRLAALKAAMGVRRYTLASFVGAVTGVVAWLGARFALPFLHAIPPLLVGLLVALAMVTWWLLEECVRLRKTISGARVELSRLRVRGVEIRNRGHFPMPDKAILEAWIAEVVQWERDVTSAIAKVNEADAVWFSVLDVVPEPRIALYGAVPSNHEKLYRQHDARLARLGDMIRNLWRDDARAAG